MSTFKIGDIVDVTGKGLMFQGQQGQVVAVTTDDQAVETIHVWHGTECDHLLDYQGRQLLDPSTAKEPPTAERYARDSRIQRYIKADLTKVDGWNPEIVANRLFGNHWHSFTVLRPTALCHINGCRNPVQKKQTFFNLWGLVMVLTTCEDCHRRNHGVCGDDFSKA